MANSFSFEDRRAGFDGRVSQATCPCCAYPTLDQRGQFDICILCQWEDDGQDDADADEESSPNQGYTLSRARRNFEAHGCLYDSEEAKSRREDGAALRAAKQDLMAAFDGLRSVSDAAAQWKVIRQKEGAVFNARHGGAV